jgi:tetratricopeptide (TPR) repeat protein
VFFLLQPRAVLFRLTVEPVLSTPCLGSLTFRTPDWCALSATTDARAAVHSSSHSHGVGNTVSNALILDWYEELGAGGDPVRFARRVSERYTEGTLQRLLEQADPATREAAVAALRFVGTMDSNAAVASCLYDEIVEVQELAEAALWAIWFRADSGANNRELQRLTRLINDKEYAKALAGLNSLIARAPTFAEAFNQRAILFWRWSEYKRSIADCEEVLRLNPLHFGAQAGMGQCYVQLKKPTEALKAFRHALRIHPNLEGVQENVHALEQLLKEARRREDRK